MKLVCAFVACFLAVSTALPVGTWTGELHQLAANSVNTSSYGCMPEVHNADVTIVFTTTTAKLVIAPGSRVASDSVTYSDDPENSDWLVASDNSTGGCLRLNSSTDPDRYFRYQLEAEGAVNETLWLWTCSTPGCPAVGTNPSCDSGLGQYCFRLKLWRHKYKLCDTYCNRYLTGCNQGQGSAASYTGRSHCLAACNGFPSGLQVMAEVDEQKYNTTECRTYHVGVALGSGSLAATHCPHASPSGGGVCAGASDPCTRYCDRVMDVAPCSTKNLYPNRGACMTACAAYSFQAAPDSKTGDNFFCRYYFASAAALTQNDLFCSTAGSTGIGRVGGMASLPMVGTCTPDWTAPWIAGFNAVPRICKAGRVLGECCCGIGVANITKIDHNFLNLYAPISGGQPCLGSSVLEIPGFFLDTPTHAKASVSITNPPVNFEVELLLQRGGNEMKLTNSLQPTCLGLSCKNLNGDCTPPGPADSTGPDPNAATSRVVSPLAALVALLAVAFLA